MYKTEFFENRDVKHITFCAQKNCHSKTLFVESLLCDIFGT